MGQWGVRKEGITGEFYHMRARYYDAITQRFISREPLWPGINNPTQLNRYQYARNNPVMRVDPAGLYDAELLKRTENMSAREMGHDLWIRVRIESMKRMAEAGGGKIYEPAARALAENEWFQFFATREEELLQLEQWQAGYRRVEQAGKEISELLEEAKREGIIGYGEQAEFMHHGVDVAVAGTWLNLFTPEQAILMLRQIEREIVLRQQAAIGRHSAITPSSYVGGRESPKKVWGVWSVDPMHGKWFYPGRKATEPFQTMGPQTTIFEGYGPAEGL